MTTALRTLKPANLTPAQAQAAKRFSAQHGALTVSQAAKWLNYIFALKRGEITLDEFQQATGVDGTPFTKYIENDPEARARWIKTQTAPATNSTSDAGGEQ